MPEASKGEAAAPAYTVLNGADGSGDAPEQNAGAAMNVASAAGAAAAATNATAPDKSTAKAASKSTGCRVWQASYGGQKAVIIKAVEKNQVNYTVLDVNEGREQREVAAYIAAYAKNGSSVGEYATSGKALSKAFELCPES